MLTMGLQTQYPSNQHLQQQCYALGKMEVSFEQWYHDGTVCERTTTQSQWSQKAYIHSLKGPAVADMARYMGPIISMAHILQKLTIIFWHSSIIRHVLMQNFYKVTQNNHEKLPSFATRLEGTLNQIWLQYPGRIMDQEVQQHLKDHLFHGVQKHIRDLIHYLYINPIPCTHSLGSLSTRWRVKMKRPETRCRQGQL